MNAHDGAIRTSERTAELERAAPRRESLFVPARLDRAPVRTLTIRSKISRAPLPQAKSAQVRSSICCHDRSPLHKQVLARTVASRTPRSAHPCPSPRPAKTSAHPRIVQSRCRIRPVAWLGRADQANAPRHACCPGCPGPAIRRRRTGNHCVRVSPVEVFAERHLAKRGMMTTSASS